MGTAVAARPPWVRHSLALPVAYFASGAAALLFEVLWFRALGRLLGNTVWAGALVLTAFMLGIALGGLLAARLGARVRRPALAFAAAELVVGITGSAIVWGLPVGERLAGEWLGLLAGHPGPLAGVRLALALAAMLVPTTAMGTTLAFGVRALERHDTAKALGILYAANTFGAALAPLAAEYYLIGDFGLRGTALVAAALNLVAASFASRLAKAPATAEEPASPVRLSQPGVLIAAALSGALALGLEVVWFRLLLLYTPATDTSFALMLTLLLLGIAAGGALAPYLRRIGPAWMAAGCGLAVVLGYVLAVPGRPGLPQLVDYAAQLMLPAAVCSGALFTLLGAQLRSGLENPQRPVGLLTCANTLGGALGAALAGFELLPRLGMETSLLLLAAGYVLVALLFMRRAALWKSALPAAAALAGLAVFPHGRIDRHLAQAALVYRAIDGSKVVQVTQGPTTTLQLLERVRFGEPAGWRLLTDSYSMSGVDRDGLRYMGFFAWLPLALHPEPRHALLISYGAGNTARALLDEPQLEALRIADVSPEILAASKTIHGDADPLRDPRVRLVVEDGRHFLRSSREQFDIITGEPPPPMMAGVVNLYTREYFAALHERLAPGGLATYWLPVHQFEARGARAVIRAFCDVFADCTLWAGSGYHWVLMGGRDFKARPGTARLTRLWRNPASAQRLVGSGFEHFEQLGTTFLADAAQLKVWVEETPPLTDDRPKRIAAEPTYESSLQEYRRWLEPGDARARFESSAWIAAHWPAELVRTTPRYFAVQPLVNGAFSPDPPDNLRRLDEVLKNTDLRVPVLWLLGSDAVEQRILTRRLAEHAAPADDPAYAYALGARALAERRYADAARLFAITAAQDPKGVGAIAAYAACRAGLGARAAGIAGAEQLAPELRCWGNRSGS